MASIALRARHRRCQHLKHSGIALVKVESDDIGISVNTERELGQIIGARGNPASGSPLWVTTAIFIDEMSPNVNFSYLRAQSSAAVEAAANIP
jgi:hypothetical protein